MAITRTEFLEEQLEQIEDELRADGRQHVPRVITDPSDDWGDLLAEGRARMEEERIAKEWPARRTELLRRRDRYRRELAELRQHGRAS
jgi:hypothetical protein